MGTGCEVTALCLFVILTLCRFSTFGLKPLRPYAITQLRRQAVTPLRHFFGKFLTAEDMEMQMHNRLFSVGAAV